MTRRSANTSPLNTAVLHLQRRAEGVDSRRLVETFVDVGPLSSLLEAHDHQIVYGRRGTGKTHAFQWLAETMRSRGDIVVYLDMRSVGSTGGLHHDPGIPLAERGTRLLVDTLSATHEELYRYVLDTSAADPWWEEGLPLLDELIEGLGDVRVVGTVERESILADEDGREQTADLTLALAPRPKLEATLGETNVFRVTSTDRLLESGTAQHRVHFGAVGSALARFLAACPSERLWILLDEWSDIPLELQPLVADFLKRCLFPLRSVTVKIGAIEYRSQFRVPTEGGGYVGLEVGADAAADVDLDDFLIFANDRSKAKEFFSELLYKHVRAVVDESQDGPEPIVVDSTVLQDRRSFSRSFFSTEKARDALVTAAEGVPRDAINVAILAAQIADKQRLSVATVQEAAARWYLRDKERAVSSNRDHLAFLHELTEIVADTKSGRTFLLFESDATNTFIQSLYDARVIHLLRRSVVSASHPQVRFDLYALDYGCYVSRVRETRSAVEFGVDVQIRTTRIPALDIGNDPSDGGARITVLETRKPQQKQPTKARGPNVQYQAVLWDRRPGRGSPPREVPIYRDAEPEVSEVLTIEGVHWIVIRKQGRIIVCRRVEQD